MFRTSSSRFASVVCTQKRGISYSLPTIKTLETIKSTNEEFTGLFSNKTVNQLWFEQGEQLVRGLNQLLEEQNVSNRPSDLNQLIIETFNKPDLYGVHSYASYLYNLQFFFESLKPDSNTLAKGSVVEAKPQDLLETPLIAQSYENEPTDPALRDWIISSFGSIAEFRTLLLNSAKSIKGSGTTWLVAQAFYSDKTVNNEKNQYATLAVMNTYNSGTVNDTLRSGQMSRLLQEKQAKAEFLKKRQDKSIQETDEATSKKSDPLVLGTVEEAEYSSLFSSKKLIPLLAIDASPRSYLLDYGVFGKQKYLDNVWKCIDWSIVGARAPPRSKPTIDYM